MRVAIGGFMLESVSFLPLLTGIAEFGALETAGPAMLDAMRGTNTLPGGFIDVLERNGVEPVPLLFVDAGAAGPASDEAFEAHVERICTGLRAAGPLDGVLLAVHGAMTTPTRLDPDRELLVRVREVIGPSTPFVVGLDYHANIDESWLVLADGMFGYHYSPHTDIATTGSRAAACLMRMLRGGDRPAMALLKPGIMVPSIFSATGLAPLSGFVDRSVAMARSDAPWLDVTIFAGFSYADVPNCGFSVLAVGSDAAEVQTVADRLTAELRQAQADLMHPDLIFDLQDGVERALKRAASRPGRPVVLLEHADRCNDSTYVLRELIRRGVGDAAVPYLWDPDAAAQAAAAGVGARVTLEVGGHSSARAGGPVQVTGTVRFAGEKTYLTTGAYMHGRLVKLGLTAVLDCDGLMLILVSRPTMTVDEDPFRQFGMRVEDFALVVLRSKTHFRAAYEPISDSILIVDTPDWGPADLTTLPYRHVPRERTFPFVGEPRRQE